ncbi:MAG: hypothetical protein RJA87_2551 [Pseudomonadota bacterium]|jgi:hypothetical protein
MIRRLLTRSALIALTSAGLLLISACGKQGKLDQPAPLFGAEAKAAYAAKKQAEADAAAKAAAAKIVTPQPVTPQEIEAAPPATPN